MNLRKFTAFALVAAMSLTSLVACSTGSTSNDKGSEPVKEEAKSDEATMQKKIVVGMITDTGGIHDKSFNQSSWEGLERAQKDGLIEAKVLESQTEADYEKNINTFVEEGVDLIIGIGFNLNKSIFNAAVAYPETHFAVIDGTAQEGDAEVPANAQGILFRADQTAFLGGYLAGLSTKTNTVGTVIGVDSAVMNEFAAGYYGGVWTANPEVKVLGQYANSFNDVAKGKNLAEQMYTQGADIIYAAAGAVGNGVIESAKERNKWVIGVDRDQYDEAPENMLSSTMKRVDVAIYELVKKLASGEKIGGGMTIFGLDDDAVGLSPSTQNIDKEILQKCLEMTEKLRSGEVVAPKSEEELMKLFPNAVSQFMK